MQKLFRSTPMMDSFGCNFNILIAGMPRVMGVREIWMSGPPGGWIRSAAGLHFVMKKKQDKLHLLKGPERKSCWTSTGPSRLSVKPRRTQRSSQPDDRLRD